MKVAVFSPYFETYGGGERYVLTVAEFFLKRNDRVDLFWKGDNDIEKIKDRFGLDLKGANFREDIFFSNQPFLKKAAETSKFDLLFFLSDGSIPISFAKKNWLHFQTPFNLPGQRSFANKLKFQKFEKIICNSNFTKHFVDKTFDIKSTVIYPPVSVDKFNPGKKTKTILSVGRFAQSNPKKHDIMVKAFSEMIKDGLKDWKLVLMGTALPEDIAEVDKLKNLSKGLPIEIVSGADYKILQNYYACSPIYWHATGFGEDLENNPEKGEHFGITTVEAMAAGAVPLSFAGGGQREIIENGSNGFLWQTVEQLKQTTTMLIKNQKKLESLSKNAISRSKAFSKENFFAHLEEILQ